MRILIMSSLSAQSGCYLRAKYLAKSLEKQGHKVILVPALNQLPFMTDVILSLVLYSMYVFFKRYDLAFGIKPYPNILWPILTKRLFCKKAKAGIDIDDIDYGYRDGIISRVSRLVQLPFPKLCDIVTYHNNNLYKYIRKEFHVDPKRMYRLDQGVELSTFTEMSDQELQTFKKQIQKKFPYTAGKLLVYTAHLNIASDLDDILKAFKEAQNKEKKARLIIAGGGPMEGDFRALVKEMGLEGKVYFTGYLEPAEIRKYVQLADHCLVYYKDKFVNYYRTSMKNREYLGMKKSVISNDVGELKNFKSVTIQSKSSVQDYTQAIIKTLKKKGEKNLKGWRLIEKSYNWDRIGEKFSFKIKKLI